MVSFGDDVRRLIPTNRCYESEQRKTSSPEAPNPTAEEQAKSRPTQRRITKQRRHGHDAFIEDARRSRRKTSSDRRRRSRRGGDRCNGRDAGSSGANAEYPVSEHLGDLVRELEQPPVPESRDLSELVQRAISRSAGPRDRRELARVDPALLENLLNNAGEVSIFHSRLTQQMGQVQFNLQELGETVARLREQLRNLEGATEAQIIYQHQTERHEDAEVDPLTLERYSKIQQLSRSLAETSNDVSSIKDLLQNLVGDTEALLVQQARTAAELQDGLMRTRMVGFHQQGARLARLARQTGSEHGKRVELTLHGGGEIDRQVLEKIMPPLEHMVRNAVIHGIETPDERAAAGKPMSALSPSTCGAKARRS